MCIAHIARLCEAGVVSATVGTLRETVDGPGPRKTGEREMNSEIKDEKDFGSGTCWRDVRYVGKAWLKLEQVLIRAMHILRDSNDLRYVGSAGHTYPCS